MALPDFVVIGAMKSGTTTLAAQLAAQEGVFLSTPKEPNFFSDDEVFARGLDWYESLFAEAAPGDLKGEASTHYAKLPTYPDCAARLHAALPGAKLIYLMREPVDRLLSQYIHEWTTGEVSGPVERALETRPELVEYSRYARQLAPYRARWGEADILLLRFEDLRDAPEATLERTGAFLGRPGAFRWQADLGVQNASAERVRRFPLRRVLVANPVARALRRTLVPQDLRSAVKRRLQMRERPSIDAETRARLETRLAEDIALWRSAALPAGSGTGNETGNATRRGTGNGADTGAGAA